MDDAIALALENNLDLAIARYNISIADTDVLRAKSGQSIRGVATGLVQGTPGGGVGGFGTGASGAGAGGTTGGAGGTGTGAGGLVTSTLGVGGPVESFDPFINGTLDLEHARTPLSTTVLTGVNNLTQNTAVGNFSYNQGWATGTGLTVGFDNSRVISNSSRTTLQPSLTSSFRATLQQHLLQGFGLNNQLRFIRIAQNNRKISDSSFRQQVETTVSQIENIYWDLVNAYEDVKVKERSLGLANKTLGDNRKQVDIGTLAPIEIVRAQSAVSAGEQDLIISQTNLQLQQSLMKNAITRQLPASSPLVTAPVIPTDTMQVPSSEPSPPIDDLLQQALTHRAELEQSQLDLTNRNITKRSAANALLPTVDVFGFYGASGLAGVPNAALFCDPVNPVFGCIPAGTPTSGFSSALGDLVNSSSPDKGAGVTISIPIRNRAAQADHVRSELEYRQAELRFQQLKNQIGIDVRNAQFALEQNRARVAAAEEGRKLGTQSLDAEQKKYALGASTTFLVLQAQRDLAQSESNLVTAMTAYEKSRVELDRVTGSTLPRNGIHLAEAEVGSVSAVPHVPYVVPQPPAQPASQPPAK
jgi:outer membrane protein